MYKGRRNVTSNLVGIITCKKREKRVQRIIKIHSYKIINFATDKILSPIGVCDYRRGFGLLDLLITYRS
jgi:hypothetical protein